MAQFEELAPNTGVDTIKAQDSWVIIPDGLSNQVMFRDGVGYKHQVKSEGGQVQIIDVPAPPSFNNPKTMVASAGRGKNDRLLKFKAGKRGRGRVHFKKGNSEVSIGFSIHPKITFKISFFFLQDGEGKNAKYRTTFREAAAKGWEADLNAVFGPQANIFFALGKADPLPLTGLGEVISTSDVPRLEEKKDKDALINVFLAGSQIKSTESDYPYGFFSRTGKLIIVKDQQATPKYGKPMLKTIAHEIAHLLNHHKTAPTPGHDYYEQCGYLSDVLNTMDGNDIKIPRERVKDWNPW